MQHAGVQRSRGHHLSDQLIIVTGLCLQVMKMMEGSLCGSTLPTFSMAVSMPVVAIICRHVVRNQAHQCTALLLSLIHI